MLTSGGGLHGLKDMIPGGFKPNNLPNLEAWYRYNVGIIVVGAGADTWADKSGNGRDLRQTTDTNRPSKESDGSVLSDGVDNYMQVASWSLEQPETVYILAKQVSWTGNDTVWDGTGDNVGALQQLTATPTVKIRASTAVAANTDWTLDTYMVLSVVFNGAGSLLQVNKETETTGNAGVVDMGGFTLARPGLCSCQFGNIQYKEAIVYSAAHDADTRTKVINYLSKVGGLGL